MKSIKNVLVLTYWSYRDPLIQTYTLPYVRLIRDNLEPKKKVFLVTLEKDNLKLNSDEKRIEWGKLREERIHWITFNYSKFGAFALAKWLFWIVRLINIVLLKNVSHIHAWCTPAGAIGYLISKITGKTLVLDSFEPHAEAMVENGVWKSDSFAFKTLFKFEKKQSLRAEHIIAATAGMKEYMLEKYSTENNSFFVKPACVNLNLFSLARVKNSELLESLGLKEKIIAVYAGKFGGIYLDKEVFDFFKVASTYWGKKFHALILSNHSSEEIKEYANLANFPIEQLTLKFVDHRKIPDYMGLADFAITPVKPVPTKRFCTPIKDGEYWALGLPVVITKDISDDSEIIKNGNIGVVLEKLDYVGYRSSVEKLDQILTNGNIEELQSKIRRTAVRYRSFEIAENIYKTIYRRE